MERFEWFIKKANIDFKQHQYDGVKWCIENELSTNQPNKVKGGFIADEMGLGKTILMIGVVLSNFRPRTLIVLPSALIDQWLAEIKRTTGHNALLYYGTKRRLISLEQLNAAPIVVTSYNMIALKKDQSTVSLLHQVKWSRLIFDEAHHLRNGGLRFWGAKRLLSPIRWLVSGTPVQNRIKDYYNMCASLNLPSTFYTQDENHAIISKTFLLRRSKLEVNILLPDCHYDMGSVSWSSLREKQLSQDIHADLKASSSSSERLRTIHYARSMCILPQLLQHALEENITTTSKLDAFLSCILSRIGNGNGKLVFCHFHLEMDTIVSRLAQNGVTNVAVFDGRSTRTRRTKILKEGYEIILLQIQSGCEGLNLQAHYSEVYFLSPNWNPAMESQAVARCHRIGQKKEVHVFRFCMEELQEDIESIEERIILLQDTKKLIANKLFEV
jgi:SNF2 family DNA or RNA helicase